MDQASKIGMDFLEQIKKHRNRVELVPALTVEELVVVHHMIQNRIDVLKWVESKNGKATPRQLSKAVDLGKMLYKIERALGDEFKSCDETMPDHMRMLLVDEILA